MLISRYLKDRKQQVRSRPTVSDPERNKPQETNIGPSCFAIYANDLLLKMSNEVIIYANDTGVMASDDTWEKAESAMNIYLNEVATWLAINQLSLNVKKTTKQQNNETKFPVNYHDIPLPNKIQITVLQ